jgi:hypothetical protein
MGAHGRIASNRRAQLGQRGDWGKREAEVLGLAERQHGVITHAQLRSLGFSPATVRHRVAAGRLHSLHRGVYVLGRADLAVEGRWMAAVLACGSGAVLSHFSAAALLGLLSTAQTDIDVTVPRRVGLARPGIRVHRSTRLETSDRSAAKTIPCTSVSRTLLDLAAVVPPAVVERACEQAETRRLLDWSDMEALMARARGRRGARSLRTVLGPSVGTGIPRSELERRFLSLCRRAGLPRPAVNQWIAVAGEELQVDVVWHGARLIVEVDGFATHGSRRAFRSDRRRDRLLALAGWRVVRFTWEDVTADAGHVAQVLRTLLLSTAPAIDRVGVRVPI